MKNYVKTKAGLSEQDEEICVDIFRNIMRARHLLHSKASNVASSIGLHAAEMNVIDIRNARDRDWALAHRFIPDRDLMIIPNVVGMNIEPMAQGVLGSNSKLGVYDGYPEIPLNVRSFMGVDCTTPLNLKVMDRVLPIAEIEARVDELWNAAAG